MKRTRWSFLDDLNTSNQKIINMTFLITCYGRSKRELENITQRVSGIIQQANCNLRCLQYLQEQGLMASAPIGCNETGIERTLVNEEHSDPCSVLYAGVIHACSGDLLRPERPQ